MEPSSSGRETVFQSKRRDECMELRLVLAAVGIPAQADRRDGWWLLTVRPQDRTRAADELAAYQQENPAPTKDERRPIVRYAGAGIAVFVFAGILLDVAVLDRISAFHLDWQSIGRMEAGKVTDGQWWRCLTALTLHFDIAHIISNLVFGAVFGLIAGRILGGGAAWLGIVIAGALGNFVNALLQPPAHSSIGASTAVFAALGMIVFHAFHDRRPDHERGMRRWSPLIGGLVLFALTGTGGDRTDVTAHLTGLFSGMLFGWLFCRLPSHWLASRRFQISTGFAAIAMVVVAWIVAIRIAT